MRTSPIFPINFRWRLAVAFLAVASVASGVVALGAYALVNNARSGAFRDRATSTTNLAASIIENAFSKDGPVDVPALLGRFDTQGSLSVLIAHDGQVTSSSGLRLEAVAPVDSVQADDRGFRRVDVEIDGRRGLLIKPPDEIEGVDAYLFFSSKALRSQMSALASSLWWAWLTVTILAGGLGVVLARHTLRPVARAGDAARSLAEGLLETRLPVGRKDEFGAWALSFNEMADALQEKIEALTEARDREVRFTSAVAHELRTPLTALVGSAQLVRPHLDELPPEGAWAAEHLLSEIVRLRHLVEELLEISRLDSGQQPVSRTAVDLESFLAKLRRRRGWSESVELEGGSCSLETDPRRLERILSNLIENAITHGAPPVRVTVVGGVHRVQMAVTDHGEGIAASDTRKIFDRFFKADPSRAGGTGLGLAIARENALLLGGDIALLNATAAHTTFVVDLPTS